MENSSPALPNLDETVQKLVELLPLDEQKRTVAQATDLYLNSIGFLCLLAHDQEIIRRHKQDQGSTRLSWSDIRVFQAVVQGPDLFYVLVQCLETSKSSQLETSDGSAVAPSSRKRSLSVTDPLLKKNGASPLPPQRNVHETNKKKPVFDQPVFAATVLYTVFQYLKHWPAPLVKAYAVDCFGPRLWVDNPECSSFVENLALSHKTSDDHASTSFDENQARLIAESYMEIASSEDRQRFAPLQQSSSSGNDRGIVKRQSSATSWGSSDHGSTKKRLRTSDSEKEDSDHTRRNSEGDISLNQSTSGDDEDARLWNKRKRESDGRDLSKEESALSGNGDLDEFTDTNDALLYPVELHAVLINPTTYQRFVGLNKECAYKMIEISLEDRLDVKAKQNSGLLQCLPDFVAIPAVRRIIGYNIERWLQSPALAGLSRALLGATVRQMENTNPPIQEDLSLVDAVLKMKLKSNQLNTHVLTVEGIARQLKGRAIVHHMYSILLRQYVSSAGRVADQQKENETFHLLCVIHKEVSPQHSYDALASSVMSMVKDILSVKAGIVEQDRAIKRVRDLTRSLAAQAGHAFEAKRLLDSFLSLDAVGEKWSRREEECRARLIFHFVILSVSAFYRKDIGGISTDDEETVRKILNEARKSTLTWFCTKYGPYFVSERKQRNGIVEKVDSISGLHPPDYRSVFASDLLDVPKWLDTILCMLLIEEPDSPKMKKLIFPCEITAEDDAEWDQDLPVVRCCCQYSDRVGSDLIKILLRSASASKGIDSEMVIQILEHLFHSCNHRKHGTLQVDDPDIIWELYSLVQYDPPRPTGKEADKDICDKIDQLPRLAYAGLWWKVTILALILSSSSPKKIGLVLWNEHPTVRSLLKMVASQRYRFPTVDCDEATRIKTKDDEKVSRETELKAVELLFLSPSNKSAPKAKPEKKHGPRMSRRLLAKEKAREDANHLHENNRKKQILKESQKAIMLWDPDGPARKPPKESISFLQAAVDSFNMSLTLQQSVDPDFLLMTIGATSRDSIERAHDWLIPVISRVPDAVKRLPSNAACFLLLRAYGTEGQQRRQLKALSAPLLTNVRESLHGKFGEPAALKALELLMADVAGKNAERRRWARRVLQDALVTKNDEETQAEAWMFALTDLPDSKALVPLAIRQMAKAASYEKGDQLRALIQSLERHMNFASQHKIQSSMESFPGLLVDLVYARPSEFVEAFSQFPVICSIASVAFHSEFRRSCDKVDGESRGDLKMTVYLHDSYIEAEFGLPLLTSIAVVLSVWREEAENDLLAAESISYLCDALFSSDSRSTGRPSGLASACLPGSKAVPVEPWILVAKARDPSIARRAASAAPPEFLVRLLQCSGLPKSSFLSMMNRLGQLGDNSDDVDTVFRRHLSPSRLTKWDIARNKGNKSLTQILLGRISAYKRLHQISQTEEALSVSFQRWLEQENKKEQAYKLKTTQKSDTSRKSTKALLQKFDVSVRDSMVSDSIETQSDSHSGHIEALSHSNLYDDSKMKERFKRCAHKTSSNDNDNKDSTALLKDYMASGEIERIGRLFENSFDWKRKHAGVGLKQSALSIYDEYSSLSTQKRQRLSALLIRWFPVLIGQGGDDNRLFQIMFRLSERSKKSFHTFESQLLHECLHAWNQVQLNSCIDWIVNAGSQSNYNCARMSQFVVFGQNQPSLTYRLFDEDERDSPVILGNEEVSARIVTVAARGLNEDKCDSGPCKLMTSASATLLLLLANTGKNPLRTCCGALLSDLSSVQREKSRQLEVFLRLYLQHPLWIDLTVGQSRTQLMDASLSFADNWGDWWSSQDDRIDDLLQSMQEGDAKPVKELSEIARKQPLLILRKFPTISQMLSKDAAVYPLKSRQKGTITGLHLEGPRDIKHGGKAIKFSCKHWGYEFFEPMWIAWLDIISHIPRVVLFSCGQPAGFNSILGVYIQLLNTQLQLLSANEVSRLKEKLKGLFQSYRQTNSQKWSEWLQSSIGSSEIRHILLGCDLIEIKEASDQFQPRDDAD